MTAVADWSAPPRWSRLSPAGAKGLAAVLALVAVGLIGTLLVTGQQPGDTGWLFPLAAFTAVGVAILRRWPGHPLGWLFLAFGVLGPASAAAGALATVGLPLPEEGLLPAEELAPWRILLYHGSVAVNTAVIATFVPLSLLLFPDGRLPSRRWRWVPWLVLVTATVGALGAALTGGWGGDPEQAEVVATTASGPVAELAGAAFFPLLTLVWVASAASLVLRWRRASGIQRVQLKFLAVGAAFAQLVLLGTTFIPPGAPGGAADLLSAAAIGAAPIAAGIAIVRHQLFDIDVVIRRSVIVAGLVAFVTGLYVAIVVGLGRLLGGGSEGEPLLAVAATAVVAVAFQPARERLTRLANRLVYGRRATPYEVLRTFGHEVGQSADVDALLTRAATSLAEGTGAEAVTVWLLVDDRLVPAAGDLARPPVAGLDALDDDLVVPVRRGGELLGAVTLVKPRAEPPTPVDAALAERLAGQLGVALANARSTAELRRTAEQLEASRRRVLTAADDQRLDLERRLSEGAGERLVALQTGLEVVRRGAADAPRTCEQLMALSDGVRAASEDIARLAAGLYPGLLQAEGLAPALRAATAGGPLAVSVDADGVGRLPADVEVAAYFAAMEALQNAVKHADAASARVTLRVNGGLTFTVTDAGRGFDAAASPPGAGLQNLRDRLAALGGDVAIRSAPGEGTTVTGTLPLREAVPA